MTADDIKVGKIETRKYSFLNEKKTVQRVVKTRQAVFFSCSKELRSTIQFYLGNADFI